MFQSTLWIQVSAWVQVSIPLTITFRSKVKGKTEVGRWKQTQRLTPDKRKEERREGKVGGRKERMEKEKACGVQSSSIYIIFYQIFGKKQKQVSSRRPFCSLRFSHFLCLNLMWKASCMPLLITNNPGNSSMPFLQLYFLYCSNKINGGNPNNLS